MIEEAEQKSSFGLGPSPEGGARLMFVSCGAGLAERDAHRVFAVLERIEHGRRVHVEKTTLHAVAV